MNTKSIPKVTLMAALLTLAASAQGAETIGGRIVGYECVSRGEVCPVDKLDPHIVLERDFVLVSGDKYYFMPNLPRDTKVRYVLDQVSVIGDVDRKYNSIKVREVVVNRNGKARTAWSDQLQSDSFRYFFRGQAGS